MGFFQKIIRIFDRKANSVNWNVKYTDDHILLMTDVDISDYPDILDIINMYNIERQGNTLFIPYDMVYDLYYDENGVETDLYKRFGLPPIFRGFVKVMNRNNFVQDKEVFYQYEIEGPDTYDQRGAPQGRYVIEKGNVVKSFIGGKYRILPKKIYHLVKEIDDYDDNPERRSSVAGQFEMLWNIKQYAEEADVVLNKRLAEENMPVIVDKIKIDFHDDGEVLEIFPRLSDDESTNTQLLAKIYDYDDVKDFYSADVNGKRIKFVIKNKDSLKKVIDNRYNRGERRLDFFTGTHPIMEDENIDLSEYGPRVIGIGYLKYRSYSMPTTVHDIDWFEKDNDLPYFYAGEEKVILTPKDELKLREKLIEMKKHGEHKAEISFVSESGKEIKTIMTDKQIENELDKLNGAIIKPWNIESESALHDIINLIEKNPHALYVTYKGKYVDTSYGKKAFEEQMRAIKRKRREREKGKKSLIIVDNIDRKEYVEDAKASVKVREAEIPSGLKEGIKLFHYQKEALAWLQNLYLANSINGFLLCDDMGLGKTLQLLAFLGWLKDRGELMPSLVVAPSTLLNNWDNKDGTGEIQKFFKKGFFDTYKFRGRLSDEEIEMLKKKDIVFTNYDSLRINSIALGKIHWRCMICDEAQKIKSPQTLVTVAAKGQNADFKIVCSATPIENTLVDLWNLVDYSKPGLLGSLTEFQKNYVKRTGGKVSPAELKKINDELYDRIKGHYIRRDKDILPQVLPKKKIRIYKRRANKVELDVINGLRKLEGNKLVLIQKMLTASSHVDLVTENNIFEMHPETLIQRSSKLQLLKVILDEIRSKEEKALIFTRSIKMQQILYKVIRHWYEIEVKIINGNIEESKRTAIIDQFKRKEGFNVIILSPEVAGFGLTITEANHVIHYSRLWNPAKEDQATDRVYRIGQDKEVTVHYPILSFYEDSIEEYDNVRDYVEHYLTVDPTHMSPEEKLNILLVRKKNMLMKFFLAVESADITNEEFFELENDCEDPVSITLEDIDRGIIDTHEFKALAALLFEKQGYKTILTTTSNDNGVDVIGWKDNDMVFVRCKKNDKFKLEEDCAVLISTGGMYKAQLGLRNVRLIIVTNAEYADMQGGRFNGLEGVEILSREHLKQLLDEYPIYKVEMEKKNKDRHSIEKIKAELELRKL